MNKFGVLIGFFGVMGGVIQIMGNLRMCRTGCWLNDFIYIILPIDYKFLANGLPAIVVGFLIIIVSLKENKK